MFKPSSVLTMVCPNGETHIQREQRFADEQRRRLMEFIISEPVKQITEKIGRQLLAEYDRQAIKHT